MADTRPCPKCQGLQLAQTLHEDLTIHQYRCLNCGRIDEPGLVPNTRRIAYERTGKYADPSANVIQRRGRLRKQAGRPGIECD